ncbi:MAG: glutaredoxin family protein [Acidimicrobiia bacterium]
MKSFAFELLTRPGCHLCDQARPLVLAAVASAGGVVREVDIDSKDALVKDYGLRIPVLLTADERVVVEGVIDARFLRRELRRHIRRMAEA